MKNIGKYVSVILLVVFFYYMGAYSAYAYSINYSNGYDNFYVDGMTIRMSSSFSSESKTATTNAIEEWDSEFSGDYMSRGSDYSATIFPLNDGVNAVTKSDKGDTWLMVCNYTTYNVFLGKIYEFDIHVNTYHPWKTDGSSDAYDVQNVMTHEVGHALGIGHSDVVGATMMQGSYLGMMSKRSIEADDKAALAYIY